MGASDGLKRNEAVVKAAVQRNGAALNHASPCMQDIQEIVIEAVKEDGEALMYASDAMKNHKEVVMIAVQRNGRALEYASAEMKKNQEVVMTAVQNHGDALRYASAEMKNNQEVVMSAVQNQGIALEHASAEMKKNQAIVLCAAKQFAPSLKWAHKDLKQKKECLEAAGLRLEQSLKEHHYEREEMGAFSVKFGLGDNAQIFSTIVALQFQVDPFLKNFRMWNPNVVSKGTCDPRFTNSDHPCRGEKTGRHKCGKFWIMPCLSGVQTYGCKRGLTWQMRGSYSPSAASCWRYSFRCQLENCKRSHGFMVQLCERDIELIGSASEGPNTTTMRKLKAHKLGLGQVIEESMADRVGLKVFRIMQGKGSKIGNANGAEALTRDDVDKIGRRIKDWYHNHSTDLSTVEIDTQCTSSDDVEGAAPFRADDRPQDGDRVVVTPSGQLLTVPVGRVMPCED